MTQFPLYLAQVKLTDNRTHEIENIRGSCFYKMTLKTSFEYLDENKTQIVAKMYIKMSGDTSGYFCTEHLMIGTTFQSEY